jgi:hypothetical protein
LPESIGKLSSLELLFIDTCMHITSLPETITQLTSLTELRLNNGEAWPVQLPLLPKGIGYLPRLEKLTMTTTYPPDDNSLPPLPPTLALSTTLREVQWGNMRLVRGSGL